MDLKSSEILQFIMESVQHCSCKCGHVKVSNMCSSNVPNMRNAKRLLPADIVIGEIGTESIVISTVDDVFVTNTGEGSYFIMCKYCGERLLLVVENEKRFVLFPSHMATKVDYGRPKLTDRKHLKLLPEEISECFAIVGVESSPFSFDFAKSPSFDALFDIDTSRNILDNYEADEDLMFSHTEPRLVGSYTDSYLRVALTM